VLLDLLALEEVEEADKTLLELLVDLEEAAVLEQALLVDLDLLDKEIMVAKAVAAVITAAAAEAVKTLLVKMDLQVQMVDKVVLAIK
jgi:hypothetical protein